MNTRSTLGSLLCVLIFIGTVVQSMVAQEPPGVVGRFGTLEYRTTGWCTAAALSPDGKVVAVAGWPSITLTDLANGKRIGQFAEHDVILLSFIEQGKTLVSVNEKGMVRYWSLEKGSESRPPWQAFLPEHNADSFYVALSPGGNLLLALDEENVNVWDLNEQKRLRQFKTPTDSGPYALAPDGNSVATFGEHGLTILDAETGMPTAATDQFKGYRVGVRFSPDGKRLVSCGGYDRYRVWDTGTLEEQFKVEERPTPEGKHQMVVSPDGKLLATTHRNGYLRLWDLESKKEIWNANPAREGIQVILQAVFFSPDQKRIICVGDEVIRIWDAASGRELAADSGPQHRASKLVASADGKTLAGNYWHTLRVWDVATFRERFRVEGVNHEIGAVFSRASDKLAYAHQDHSVRVVDTLSGNELVRLDRHTADIAAIAFAADDKEVLTAGRGGTLRVRDVATGKDLRKYVLKIPDWYGKNPPHDRRYDAFSADGQTLVTMYSGKDDCRLWHYSTKTGERVAEGESTPPLSAVCLAPDGRTFVGQGRGGTLDVFDMATGNVTLLLRAASKEYPDAFSSNQRVTAYSPDSRFVAVSDEKNDVIKIWDVDAQKKVHTIPHRWTAEFTFVGNNFLATPAADTTILLWDVSELRKEPAR
jgi:WD40 repeat protein